MDSDNDRRWRIQLVASKNEVLILMVVNLMVQVIMNLHERLDDAYGGGYNPAMDRFGSLDELN